MVHPHPIASRAHRPHHDAPTNTKNACALALGYLGFVLASGAAPVAAQPQGWSHQAAYHATNPAGVALTGYQIAITIDTAALVTAGEMQADGADIRVAVDCPTFGTLIPLWVERPNTTTTRIWVRADVPATGLNMMVAWGNPAATSVSNVFEVFDQDDVADAPFSGTERTTNSFTSSVADAQRGFRFIPTVDVVVISLGKYEPNGTPRDVTLWDFTTQTILEQVTIAGPATAWTYTDIDPIVLDAGQQYLITIFTPEGQSYYFGAAPTTNSRIAYQDMRYCNGCTSTTFPMNVLTNIHYGYEDFLFLARKPLAQPLVVGPGGLDTATCDADLTAATCGDGYANAAASEACDDMNADDTDGCLGTCEDASCGDGFVHAGVEGCDDMNADETDACRNNCVAASCGDGIVQAGVETCDDTNTDDTDACLSTCQIASCGDGALQAGVETCDDGNVVDTDGCRATCIPAVCGDGVTRVGVEGCDDANDSDIDGCRRDCALPSCGDSLLQPGEACEDGNTIDTDGCTNTCMYAICGDGRVRTGVEACDDANTMNGDGCSSTCTVETLESDAGVDGGTTPTDGGGCGCSVIGATSQTTGGMGAGAWLALIALGAALVRRRVS